jgi:hypothetical protein
MTRELRIKIDSLAARSFPMKIALDSRFQKECDLLMRRDTRVPVGADTVLVDILGRHRKQLHLLVAGGVLRGNDLRDIG